MSRRGRDPRDRNLRRRGQKARGTRKHSTVVCPECRVHIPVMEGFNEVPSTCPGCEARLRCETCGANLVEEERESRDGEETPLERGECPRCENPVDGSGSSPTDEDFTWKDT